MIIRWLLTQRISAKVPFFILAALCAIVAPALWVLSLTHVIEFSISTMVHGRSLLLGFTSALIAGYLMGSRSVMELIGLIGLWLASRVTEIMLNNYSIPLFLQLVMGVYLALLIAPKFLAAKKWRNLFIAPLVTAIVAFPAVIWVMPQFRLTSLHTYQLFAQLLTLLMFFMAGRMITPLLVKAASQKGVELTHRVQPNIERAVFVLTGLAVLGILCSNLGSASIVAPVIGSFQITIAALIAIRIIRWQPWRLSIKDAPVWSLLLGYLWLALAQMVLGIEQWQGSTGVAAFHLLMLGGLGSLSSVIMLLSCYKHQPLPPVIYLSISTLLAISALSRYLVVGFPEHSLFLLWISLSGWVFVYTLVLILVVSSLLRKHSKSSVKPTPHIGQRIL
jgi:uncharacterized protein involved in response to NO